MQTHKGYNAKTRPGGERDFYDRDIKGEDQGAKPGKDKSVLGPDEKVGSENAGKNKGLGNEGRFSQKG